jgi:hypothetical protein
MPTWHHLGRPGRRWFCDLAQRVAEYAAMKPTPVPWVLAYVASSELLGGKLEGVHVDKIFGIYATTAPPHLRRPILTYV